MERHKCKLCSRTFTNGRALGGHMKAHLAALPLPPKPQPNNSFSYSSCSSESEEQEEVVVTVTHDNSKDSLSEEKALIYGLRENPKKSFRLADPEFSAAFCSVIQDRESETESKNNNNTTRKRSKRSSKPVLPFSTEPEPVSSVSDPSPDEDVAMCLMMLSRDTRITNFSNVRLRSEQNHNSNNLKRVRGKNLCESCGKAFRSSRALASHTRICCRQEETNNNEKIFQCPFCFKVFGSGQALGGHKRSHLVPSSSSILSVRFKESFIDLNLPAPTEEDDLSVLSDA